MFYSRVIAKITEIKRVTSKEEIDEFVETEWDILNDLNHSNIVRYFEFFSDMSRIYQLREYCEVWSSKEYASYTFFNCFNTFISIFVFKSESLREIFEKRLATKKYFEFDVVFSIFLQVLDALAYLNSRNLILEYLNTE